MSEVFNDSYERIFGQGVGFKRNGDAFFDYFYWDFINRSPEVGKAFANTDMQRQKSMLKKSMMYAVNYSCVDDSAEYMERIAERHSARDLNINPALYELWMDSMIVAVKRFDPKFDRQVELAWRMALDHAITYMKFMHTKS